MKVAPKALSLDLDDTLWPIWPVIEKAEQALADFLAERCPKTAKKYPVREMRALRDRIAADYPQFAHDFTHQRRLSLAHALRSAGEDEAHVEDAFNAFYAARNRVDFYPDALHALEREAGHAKPDAPIFYATCKRLGVQPFEVLHVGDDPWMDVMGAAGVGMRTCWINRREEEWPSDLAPPDLHFRTLAELADWLDSRHPHMENA